MTDEEFSQQYMTHLNPQQQTAVRAVDGAVLLLAVPGSGKTTVLVTRLGYMTAVAGVDPASILTTTYTRAATKEMRERCGALFGAATAEKITFSTINALSLDVVRYYSRYHGRGEMFRLMEEGETSRLVGELYRNLTGEFATDSAVSEARTAITYIKNMMLTEKQIAELGTGVEKLPELYARYNETLRRLRRMDFDDQMVYALTALRTVPQVLRHFRERYRYLCVDESQDTSKIQHQIIRLLAGERGNLFMVGDEDQSIYGFRAAYPQALMRFPQEHPGARVLLMEENYRSTREIVSASAAFVARNRDRYQKTMRAARGSGARVRGVRVSSREGQFQYLCDLARRTREPVAVLYRNNDSALPLIDGLERGGIPYRCRSFDPGFFSHRVVLDVTDIIRFAGDAANGELFLRIYYKFNAAIPKAAAVYAANKSAGSGRPVLRELLDAPELSDYSRGLVKELSQNLTALRRDDGERAVNRIWYALRYGQYVRERQMDGGKRSILSLLGQRVESAQALLDRLDTLREIVQTHQNQPEAMLTLSTIHSSKGLEYPRVYLLDVLDGILPALTEEAAETPAELRQYQEERRLFYVGMTRARDELYLFRCLGEPSEFVAEVMKNQPAPPRPAKRNAPPPAALAVGVRVRHRLLGPGTVTDVDPARDRISIAFDRTGETKTFELRFTLDRGLLLGMT